MALPRKSSWWWLTRDRERLILTCLWFVAIVAGADVLGAWSGHALFGPRPPVAAPRLAQSDDEIYTGSIVAPLNGDECWQRLFDNRRGRMWDAGVVSCEGASAQVDGGVGASARLETIRRGFRGE